MNLQSASLDLAPSASESSRVRPLYWSLRRELWENRFLWIVPSVVALIVLITGVLTSIIVLARSSGPLTEIPPAILKHLDAGPAPIMLCSLLVGFFYALDALYGERRDRSILFWKSLPVSDATSVIAKMLIPVIVVPGFGLALSIATQLMLLVAVIILTAPTDLSIPAVWRDPGFFESLPIMTYGLYAQALWFAPLYAWALLISAWARRAPALWLFVPPMLLIPIERMITGTNTVGKLIAYRLLGGMRVAFDDSPASREGHIDSLAQLEPVKFFSTPGLWLGLLFAAAATYAAIRLRRRREPH